jgi:hypothetical protein
MNQGTPWVAILQRPRLRMADFANLGHLAERWMAFVAAWNEPAPPLQWATTSVAKVMATCDITLPKAA